MEKRPDSQSGQKVSAILLMSESTIRQTLFDERPGTEKDTPHMDDQEIARRITSLEARMHRMETLMQRLLTLQTNSRSHADEITQMQSMLQELRSGQDIHMTIPNLAPAPLPSQERPEIAAIRQALLSGNKLKAIQLYRSLYNVGLKEAQAALDAM